VLARALCWVRVVLCELARAGLFAVQRWEIYFAVQRWEIYFAVQRWRNYFAVQRC
jgi:hypothetical protein